MDKLGLIVYPPYIQSQETNTVIVQAQILISFINSLPIDQTNTHSVTIFVIGQQRTEAETVDTMMHHVMLASTINSKLIHYSLIINSVIDFIC